MKKIILLISFGININLFAQDTIKFDGSIPTPSNCSTCGIYEEKDGEGIIAVYDTLMFHFSHKGKDAANIGFWKLSSGKINWYMIPDTCYIKYQKDIEANRYLFKEKKNLISKIVLENNLINKTNELKFENLNFDATSKIIQFGNNSFVKSVMPMHIICSKEKLYGKYQLIKYLKKSRDEGYLIIDKDNTFKYYKDKVTNNATISGILKFDNSKTLFYYTNDTKVIESLCQCEGNNKIINVFGEFVKLDK